MNKDLCTCILTNSSSVPLKIPAPPDAKLTPVTTVALLLLNFFDLDTSDRYGGAEGNPTFSAVDHQNKSNQ